MWPAALEAEPVRGVLARATPLHGYTLRMFGVPESEIAKSLREIESGGVDLGAVEITTCLRRGEIEIDVRYRDEAVGIADAVREGLAERHQRHLFSLDGETIDSQVAALLKGRRLGLAESCSGGLLAARITDVPGASEYMAGSVVAYSNEAKAELLGVDPALIEEKGAVSPEVAEAMAIGRHRPRPGHPRRSRRHPRPLRPGRHAPAADAPQRRRAAALAGTAHSRAPPLTHS